MKRQIEGYTIYNLTNELQIYDGRTLVKIIWKSGELSVDLERLSEAIEELTR